MIEFNGSRKTIFISILSIVLLVFSALSMIRSSDWKTNLSLFEKGVLRSPNSSRTHYSLATEYMTLGRNSEDVNERTDYLNKAITSFAKSLSIYPENKLSHYNSGICLSMLGDTVNAIAAYKKAIQIDSNYLTSVNNLGVIYQALHAYDSSEQCYMHALRVDPAATLPKKNLGDLYIMKGITLSQQGHDDEALQSYKTSLQYNSANLILLNNIASIYSSVKKFDSALIYLNMGLAADPGNLMIVENLAAVYYLNGNYTQAITLANRALAIKPNSRKSYGVLMDTYNAMGNSKEGERYKKLYESSPR
jgi:superkiller protein 3